MARVRFSPVPPMKTLCRRRLVARIADLQSADGSSILLAGTKHLEVTSRLWPRGFRLRSSKAGHAGSSPARRSMPRSFNGRTKVFGAFYVGSIPALGAKIVLAWCTVHRRTYKPLRSRLEHGLGSTPSASTMRSKLMRMSRRFLIVRQLVRFQPDAPRFRNCGRMVRRSTFNRGGESSILSSSTNN